MERAMGNTMEGMVNYSPTLVVRGITSQEKRAKFLTKMPRMLLMHGSQDFTVPFYSTQEFHQALKGIQADAKMVIIPQAGHIEFVTGLFPL